MVTSIDVAAAAGVAQSTVSRALRNSSSISPPTRQRVRDAAERLGYVPSLYGRQLRTKRSGRVGVLATEIDNPFYPSLLAALHASLRDRGLGTVLVTEPPSTPDAVATLVDGSFDGLILTTCRLRSRLPALLRAHGMPVVVANREVEPQLTDSCTVDNIAGGMLVARAIVEAGHHRIGLVAGPPNTSTGRDRTAGFRRGLRVHAIRPAVRHGEFSVEVGRDSVRHLMADPDPPTALFCANDVLAVGGLNALHELGLRVPRDVSLVGFDDIALAAWETFGLTTIHCDLAAMARQATQLLLNRIERPHGSVQRHALAPHLVTRRTLGPPRRP